MSEVDREFPAWRYGPNGDARIFQRGDSIPSGWRDHPFEKAPGPLDHDKDGRAGGSITALGDLKALRVEYKKVSGKNAFNGWDEATLRAKIKASG